MRYSPLLLLYVLLVACSGTSGAKKDSSDTEIVKRMINGVSFVNTSYKITADDFQSIVDVNANWITTMPFGFILKGDDSVQYNTPNQWYGETFDGIREIVELSHQKGLKVLIKPHIWAMDVWVGDVEFTTEKEWQTFEQSYTDFIVDFAKLAESTNADAFCIGVEMKKVVQQRKDYWPKLIKAVRTVYHGPITYAANWDNYKNVSFWSDLDYIGIDAYFPVANSQTPSIDECFKGWETDFNDLKTISATVGKPVIFTEFGYRNTDYSAKEPWDENSNATFNTQAQSNAYQALFNKFWVEDWFAGGFLWKWHVADDKVDSNTNNRFTPQNKPVETIIREVYTKSK